MSMPKRIEELEAEVERLNKDNAELKAQKAETVRMITTDKLSVSQCIHSKYAKGWNDCIDYMALIAARLEGDKS